MSNIPYEFGKALPDQITTERLQEARFIVARVCDLDVDTVHDSITLAQNLQGVSRAVSDIVLAKGAVETTDLRTADHFDPQIMPAIAAGNILRNFDDPAARIGRMFVAQPSIGYGASMGVYEVGSTSQQITHEIHLPKDQQIDKLLTQEPCFWTEMGPYSMDFRNGRPDAAYPFHNKFYADGTPQKYLTVAQELSTELLKVIE